MSPSSPRAVATAVIDAGRPSDISAARLSRFLYGVSHSPMELRRMMTAKLAAQA